MSELSLKSKYIVSSRHEAFYTGGGVYFSSDGQYMFCGCGNRVQVLHLQQGTLFQTIGKEEDPDVTCFIPSPDDQYVVLAGRELLLTQYDWKTNLVVRKWRAIHTNPVNCMAFDCTSTLLATGGSDATIKVWDIVRQYCTHNLRGHQGVISTVLFHPDIDLLQLFSSGDDYQIRQWDLSTGQCLHVFSGHYSSISTISITPCHRTMVSGGRDSVVLCWNLEDKTKTTIPVYESVESVLILDKKTNYAQFNIKSDSEDLHVLTAGDKGVLKVWNTRSGHCVFSKPINQRDSDDVTDGSSNHVSQAVMVSSLNVVAVVTYQHNIILYRVNDLTVYKQFAGFNDDILDVKLFGNDESRLVVCTNTEQIKVFQTDTWHCSILPGHTDIVMCVDVYKTGQYMVSASKDKDIRVWTCSDNEISCIAVGQGHSKAVNTIAMSRCKPDFCVSAGEDHTLKLWQMSDAINPRDVTGKRCDVIRAHMTERAHDKDINSVAVSPNDTWIVTGSQDKTAKLWRAADLSLVGVFRGHKRGIWCVTFSPVDQAIATASADCQIKIWSLTDFTCVKTFEGHESSVLKVVFVSRGMQLVSSGSDGLMKLWTMKSNECVATFDEHTDKIWALCSSSTDQGRLVTGGADSMILIWKDVTEEEIQEERCKQSDLIIKEQKLLNLIEQKRFVKAIGLAITLEQPYRLLYILQTVLTMNNGIVQLEETLLKLRPDQIAALLRFAVDWNTNSKYSYEAQSVLNIVLRCFSPQQILDLPNIKSLIEGFIPYTDRHFQRLSRLKQQSTFIDYSLNCMKLTDNTSSRPSTSTAPLPVNLDIPDDDSADFVVDKMASLGTADAHGHKNKNPCKNTIPSGNLDFSGDFKSEEEEMESDGNLKLVVEASDSDDSDCNDPFPEKLDDKKSRDSETEKSLQCDSSAESTRKKSQKSHPIMSDHLLSECSLVESGIPPLKKSRSSSKKNKKTKPRSRHQRSKEA